MRVIGRQVVLMAALAAAACGSGGGRTCTAGEREICECQDGEPGERICETDGVFSDCLCYECAAAIRCLDRADCPGVGGGDASCWQCLDGCCVAAPQGSDPFDECSETEGATACTRNVCDGTGGCRMSVARDDGTACGSICDALGATAVLVGECRGGVCDVDVDRGSMPCDGCCSGDLEGCDSCPPEGCTATCEPSDRTATCE